MTNSASIFVDAASTRLAVVFVWTVASRLYCRRLLPRFVFRKLTVVVRVSWFAKCKDGVTMTWSRVIRELFERRYRGMNDSISHPSLLEVEKEINNVSVTWCISSYRQTPTYEGRYPLRVGSSDGDLHWAPLARFALSAQWIVSLGHCGSTTTSQLQRNAALSHSAFLPFWQPHCYLRDMPRFHYARLRHIYIYRYIYSAKIPTDSVCWRCVVSWIYAYGHKSELKHSRVVFAITPCKSWLHTDFSNFIVVGDDNQLSSEYR